MRASFVILAEVLFFDAVPANASVVAKLNPATATISDDAIKAIVLVLKLLMFSLSSLYMIRGIFQYEEDTA